MNHQNCAQEPVAPPSGEELGSPKDKKRGTEPHSVVSIRGG
jgi:hypothetical protein